MSIQYQKEIFNNGILSLHINIAGVDINNVTNKDDFSLSIYALNRSTFKSVFSESLNFEQAKAIYTHLNSISIIREDGLTHTSEFVEVTNNVKDILSIINKVDSSLVKSILSKVDANDKLKLVLEALTESEIQNLHASIQQTNHQKSLVNLRQLLDLEEKTIITDTINNFDNLIEYIAGQSEKIFQNWIEKNIWTLGVDYIQKHPARQIGINSESDLIMETTDGFIDLIELKRPKFNLFDYDQSHKSYYPSKELSKVIGQCMQYLKVLDDYKLVLEKQHRFKLLKPRVKIIVGRTNNFNDEQFEALRMLNSSLNHIQIISYDYLCLCGDNIISYYSRQLEKQ
ncbi:Shedu anti-phage system protein SduA domain-containing protein [uncultured Acetobacteroides sp.]|uniref:Shedu anti-phage system protein SduA domain-containing protein n=1 Tax=uncultured Acetobacteroides sp. TaxID=1760811 RepID=UPI0029F4AAC6|nr:Shedu anti-phage system protein SduA domain-containing protein [uncultured Acetobacteroides sp.]